MTIFSSTFFKLLIIILSIPAILINPTLDMINVWSTNETFTHGFLVAPISLWLIWQKKSILENTASRFEPIFFIFLIPILMLFFAATVSDIKSIQQLSLVAIILSTILVTLGRDIFFTILFPLLFLFFAVPLGQGLIPPLMDFTAYFTVLLIKLTGIPIYQDGLYFSLPSGNWSVVEECSGVRYLITSITLGTIYAYLTFSSYTKRTLFILVAIILPIIANSFRAFGIVMIGHYSDMTLAVGVDHLLYGWVFFGIIIFIMFYVGSFWADPIEKTETVKNTHDNAKSNSYVFLAMCLILIYASSQFSQYTMNIGNNSFKVTTQKLPDNFNAWQKTDKYSINWAPILHNPSQAFNGTYRFSDDIVKIDIGFFNFQNEKSEAISSLNKLTDPYNGKWKLTSQIDLQQQDIYVSEATIRYQDQQLLIWQWYKVGNTYTPNKYIAKALELYNKIIAHRTDISYITIATYYNENPNLAREKLSEFWQQSENEITGFLDELKQ